MQLTPLLVRVNTLTASPLAALPKGACVTVVVIPAKHKKQKHKQKHKQKTKSTTNNKSFLFGNARLNSIETEFSLNQRRREVVLLLFCCCFVVVLLFCAPLTQSLVHFALFAHHRDSCDREGALLVCLRWANVYVCVCVCASVRVHTLCTGVSRVCYGCVYSFSSTPYFVEASSCR